jgi:glutathione S-transferase
LLDYNNIKTTITSTTTITTSTAKMPSPVLTIHHLRRGQGERIPFLLEELGLPYTLVAYDRAPMLSPPALKAKHPLGASPVLEDTTDPAHPVTLAESSAIAEYLIQRHGAGRLALPPQHANYPDYLYWFHFANGTLQPGLFRRAMMRGAVGRQDKRYLGTDARVRTAVAHVNARLENAEWLAGDEFTAADVMTVWCFTTMRVFEPIDLSEYPAILRWLGKVGQRKTYRTAMAKGDPGLDVDVGLSAQGHPQMELFERAMAGKM